MTRPKVNKDRFRSKYAMSEDLKKFGLSFVSESPTSYFFSNNEESQDSVFVGKGLNGLVYAELLKGYELIAFEVINDEDWLEFLDMVEEELG